MANRIKGITVEIGGDTTGLDKALKSVNSSITKTQSALNDVNRLLKLDPSNTVLVAQKQELLAQAVSQTEEKLSALEAAQEQVAAAFARGHIGADKYQAFQREIEETRGKLNKYKADLSNLQTEQDALSQNTARLEKKDILFPTNFTMPAVKKVSDDPFEQAAYAYSLIESEVDGDGTK